MWVIAIIEGLFDVLTAPRGERLVAFLAWVAIFGVLFLVFYLIKWS